jgi:anti-sigma factor RsiW
MMHLDDELIQRTLHGELSARDLTRVREHTANCPDCRAMVERARLDEQAVNSLLRQLDHPMPPMRATAVLSAAQPSSMRWLRYAAALLLISATLGGVAYAASGAPLPEFVQRIVTRLRTSPRRVPSVSSGAGSVPVAVTPPPAQPGAAGVAVAPGRSLTILFATSRTGGMAQVTLTDDEDVSVRAPSGAAEFTSTDGRLAIVNRASNVVYEIGIPRNAAHIEIRVDGRRLFVLDGQRITSSAVAAGGRYLLQLR